MKQLFETILPSDVIEYHKQLDPDLWHNDKLDNEIEQKMKLIAHEFFDYLNLPSNVTLYDIIFTGSEGNFNWTEKSDLDLHLIVDFSSLSPNHELVQDYFNAKKTLWNSTHTITIRGRSVELYVQDIHDKIDATAIWSVKNSKWIKHPKYNPFIISKDFNPLTQQLIEIINNVLESNDRSQIEYVLDQLYAIRQNGLDKGGEGSPGNLAFKVIRSIGLLDQMKKIIQKDQSEELSLI